MTAARIAIDKLNFGVASLRRRQRYEPSGALVKVNLGSGLAIAPGWINIDMNASTLCAPLPVPALRLVYHLSSARRWANAEEYVQKLKGNILVHHNLVYGIPLTDESADYVYSAHFFEHLYREDAERLFREARRILKPDGVLRINVPSLEPWVAALAAGDTETGLEGFFPRSSRDDKSGLGRHRYMYDFNLLRKLLQDAGFASVDQRERRRGAVPDLNVFEHRSEHGLYVEARRSVP